MLLRADWSGEIPTVTLGDLILPAEQYGIQCAAATVQAGLADGIQTENVLGEKPCRFTFSGRTAAFDCLPLLCKLRAAMQMQSEFSFTFCGADFSGMRIIACSCETAQNPKIAAFSVTMTGSFSEAVDP